LVGPRGTSLKSDLFGDGVPEMPGVTNRTLIHERLECFGDFGFGSGWEILRRERRLRKKYSSSLSSDVLEDLVQDQRLYCTICPLREACWRKLQMSVRGKVGEDLPLPPLETPGVMDGEFPGMWSAVGPTILMLAVLDNMDRGMEKSGVDTSFLGRVQA